MTIEQISQLLDAAIICGADRKDHDIKMAFASDLMSDVLTLSEDNVMLITGLANLQALRTAEMSEIHAIVFGRGKIISEEMKELAEENNIIVLQCRYSVFRICGLLFKEGILPVF
jgi:predicted transcriptional regulator